MVLLPTFHTGRYAALQGRLCLWLGGGLPDRALLLGDLLVSDPANCAKQERSAQHSPNQFHQHVAQGLAAMKVPDGNGIDLMCNARKQAKQSPYISKALKVPLAVTVGFAFHAERHAIVWRQ
jgi:hypothetical protein